MRPGAPPPRRRARLWWRRPRGLPVEVVDVDRWQAELDAGGRRRPPVVVLDVEPYVAPWRTDQATFDSGAARLAERWADQQVLVVTNSPRRLGPEALPGTWRQVSRARKPFTRLDVPPGSAVVGDQPLQDGLLAFRLQATFVRVPLPDGAPWWARATHAVFTPLSGRWLRGSGTGRPGPGRRDD